VSILPSSQSAYHAIFTIASVIYTRVDSGVHYDMTSSAAIIFLAQLLIPYRYSSSSSFSGDLLKNLRLRRFTPDRDETYFTLIIIAGTRAPWLTLSLIGRQIHF